MDVNGPNHERAEKLRRLFRQSAISREVWQHESPCGENPQLANSKFFEKVGGGSYRVEGKMGLGEETPDLSGIVLVHLNDDMQVEAVVYRAEDNQEGIVAIGSRTAENWVPMVIAQLGQDGRIIGLLDLLAHPTQQPNIFSVVENEIGITLFPLVPTNDPMHGILAETMIDTIIDDVMQRSRPIAPLGINGGLSP